MGVAPEELEDCCQEVFVRCYRALPSFRGESQFKTWFYRLCLTEATRARRRQRLLRTIRQLALGGGPPCPFVEPEISPTAAARQVEAALSRMSHGNRTVFVLYELEGIAGKDIAELLGCPAATVWRRLHYARRTFKDAFALNGLV